MFFATLAVKAFIPDTQERLTAKNAKENAKDAKAWLNPYGHRD